MFNSSTFEILFQILSIIIGILYGLMGIKKLWGWEWGKQSYLKHHPLWVYYTSAVVELIGGIGLCFPMTRFISAVGILIMIVWVASRSWKKFELKSQIPQILFTSLIILIILLSWLW